MIDADSFAALCQQLLQHDVVEEHRDILSPEAHALTLDPAAAEELRGAVEWLALRLMRRARQFALFRAGIAPDDEAAASASSVALTLADVELAIASLEKDAL